MNYLAETKRLMEQQGYPRSDSLRYSEAADFDGTTKQDPLAQAEKIAANAILARNVTIPETGKIVE